MVRMKGRLSIFAMAVLGCAYVAQVSAFSCGAGYVYEKARKNIDGIETYECQKLWCYDLETGKVMGAGDDANSGYRQTSAPVELYDADNNAVECWGERVWCAGEPNGVWNAEYGMYTRGGADSATYQSYKKGSCFAWRLAKPKCGAGESAILKNDEWVCVTQGDSVEQKRTSTIRRTGTIRRMR